MSNAISPQHPAVVLRSHYTLVRALLAAAVVAILALAVAVVILAGNGDAGATSALPQSAPAVPEAVQDLPPGVRYDGGPDEGTRGIAPVEPPASGYNGPH